jgi:hypothetical protein
MYYISNKSEEPHYLGKPSIYEQNIKNRQQLKSTLPQYVERQLKLNFPFLHIIIHSLLLILLSLAQIGIQIYLLVIKSYLSTTSVGIWAGFLGEFKRLFLLKLKTKTNFKY